MIDLYHFWMLAPDEQEAIRQAYPCFTEEEHQAFLNALFPAHNSVEEADAVYDLSETQGKEHPQ